MQFEYTPDYTALRKLFHRRIDFEAGSIRSKYITVAPGQDMVYQQKQREAEMISANPDISVYEVPHLASEAALYSVSLLDMATTILVISHQWAQLSSLIERKRLEHKDLVTAAISKDQIESAAVVDWAGL